MAPAAAAAAAGEAHHPLLHANNDQIVKYLLAQGNSISQNELRRLTGGTGSSLRGDIGARFSIYFIFLSAPFGAATPLRGEPGSE